MASSSRPRYSCENASSLPLRRGQVLVNAFGAQAGQCRSAGGHHAQFKENRVGKLLDIVLPLESVARHNRRKTWLSLVTEHSFLREAAKMIISESQKDRSSDGARASYLPLPEEF